MSDGDGAMSDFDYMGEDDNDQTCPVARMERAMSDKQELPPLPEPIAFRFQFGITDAVVRVADVGDYTPLHLLKDFNIDKIGGTTRTQHARLTWLVDRDAMAAREAVLLERVQRAEAEAAIARSAGEQLAKSEASQQRDAEPVAWRFPGGEIYEGGREMGETYPEATPLYGRPWMGSK